MVFAQSNGVRANALSNTGVTAEPPPSVPAVTPPGRSSARAPAGGALGPRTGGAGRGRAGRGLGAGPEGAGLRGRGRGAGPKGRGGQFPPRCGSRRVPHCVAVAVAGAVVAWGVRGVTRCRPAARIASPRNAPRLNLASVPRYAILIPLFISSCSRSTLTYSQSSSKLRRGLIDVQMYTLQHSAPSLQVSSGRTVEEKAL